VATIRDKPGHSFWDGFAPAIGPEHVRRIVDLFD